MIPCQLITPLILAVGGSVIGQGVTAQTSRVRFPRLRAGAIGQAVAEIRRLSRQGLTPATDVGPFGNLVVGTADQNLPLLAEEAALRQIRQEVLTEVLAEDPLLFIRNLPPGDPRRVAVGLDPPGVASRIAPSPGSPETVNETALLRQSPAIRQLPTTARARPTEISRGRAFSTRASLGRFAVR